MKLIENLGVQLSPTPKNPTYKTTVGIFECPVCNDKVTRAVSTGARNKTCGNKVCRKAAFSFNYSANYVKNTSPLYKEPYHTTVLSAFRSLVAQYSNPTNLSNNDFYALVKEEYLSLRKVHRSVEIGLTDKALGVVPGNIIVQKRQEVTSFKTEEYLEKLFQDKAYDSAVLAHVTSKTHQYTKRVVVTAYGKDLPSITYKTSKTLSKNVQAIKLTEEQFSHLRSIIMHNSKKAVSNILYIIESIGIIKIGITGNIEKRVRGLEASSPSTVTVLATYSIANARDLELYLHKKYAGKNHKFEWFSLSHQDVSDIYSFIEMTTVDGSWVNPEIVTYTPTEITSKSTVPVVKEKFVFETTSLSTPRDRTNQIASTTTHGKSSHPLYSLWNDTKVKARKEDVPHQWLEDLEGFIEYVQPMYDNSKDSVPSLARRLTANGYVGGNLLVTDKSKASVVLRAVIRTDKAGVSDEFASAKEAAQRTEKATAGHITACASGKRNSHAGFSWEYMV